MKRKSKLMRQKWDLMWLMKSFLSPHLPNKASNIVRLKEEEAKGTRTEYIQLGFKVKRHIKENIWLGVIPILQKCNLKENKRLKLTMMKTISICLKELKNKFTVKEFKIANTISSIPKLNKWSQG